MTATDQEHAFWCEQAWIGGGPAGRVRVIVKSGRIASLTADVAPAPDDHRLPGLVLPGFANAHSHAFHRALRGRTHDDGGSFWTWRRRMYAVAAQLDPDSYLALARATYAEMALAGATAVGEFHYLHHPAGGGRYDDPDAMGAALEQAAADAGIRLTLLDTCYLAGGLDSKGHRPLDDVQQRFSDGSVGAWAQRVSAHADSVGLRRGVAVHSVRAVPEKDMPDVVAAAGSAPLHVHVSEQEAENEACMARYGRTPTAVLHDAGVLRPGATAVHGTHVSDQDIALLAGSGTVVCACPGTEADLADGIGPFGRMLAASIPLCLGSDQHVLTDMLGEARLLEHLERLGMGSRGRTAPACLVEMLTSVGHASLGWPDAGRIEPGARADLVAVRLDSVRTAGCAPAQVVLAAGAADVHTVVVDGRVVVQDGRHRLGDVGRLLAKAIEPLWSDR